MNGWWRLAYSTPAYTHWMLDYQTTPTARQGAAKALRELRLRGRVTTVTRGASWRWTSPRTGRQWSLTLVYWP